MLSYSPNWELTIDTKPERIQRILDETIPNPEVPLDHKTPFQLLVAVLLSAQCTDIRVNIVTPALFQRAPDAETMATLTANDILPFIRTCGLAPTKSKNLAATARLLVNNHGGEIPADMTALEALPGVGHKTASVVMNQAFGVATFPVDTHIKRLATRWGLSSGKNVTVVERDLKKVFAEDVWGKLHLQMIIFGRTYCPARGHNPNECPVCSWASAEAM